MTVQYDLPVAIRVISLKQTKTSLEEGEFDTVSVTLNTPVPPGGMAFVAVCNRSGAPCPNGTVSPLTIAGGQSTGTFTVTRTK